MTAPRMLVLMAVWIFNASCTAASTSDGSPAGACRAREELVTDITTVGADLYVLTRERIAEVLDRRHDLLVRMAEGTDGSLSRNLHLESAFRDEVGRRLLGRWGSNDGERLKEEATAAGFSRVREYLLREPPTVDSRRLTSRALDALATRNELRLGVLCKAFRPIDPATTRVTPIPNDVVAIDLDRHRLVRIDARSRTIRPLDGPAGWTVERSVATSPDASTLGFLADNEEGRIDVFVGPASDPSQATRLTAATLNAGCFSWSPSGKAVLASVGFGRPDHRLQIVELSGGITDVPLAVQDPEAVGCASFLTESEILVETGELERDDVVIQATRAEGGDLRPFVAMNACNLVDPKASTANDLVFFSARCADIGRSGLYSARMDGSEVRQLVPGLVGTSAVTGDGDWVVFSYGEPEGDGFHPALYALNLNSMSLVRVADAGLAWPTWAE